MVHKLIVCARSFDLMKCILRSSSLLNSTCINSHGSTEHTEHIPADELSLFENMTDVEKNSCG